jgi:flagellar biosynthesis/type III secretory pathway protein FliH
MSNKEDSKITPFKPQNLEAGVAIKSFQPKAFGTQASRNGGEFSPAKQQFGTMANSDKASGSRFDLHPASKKLLGVEQDETSKIDEMVNAEVERQLSLLRDQAHQQGFEQGMVEGKAQAEVEYLASVKPLYDQFEALCQSYDQIKQEVYVANEQFLVQLMFQFGKHIVLKELSTDREYVKRLSSLMIEKIGAKDHVKLKVSRQDFANLEQIRDHLKAQFPDLKNVQIEISEDLALGGCKVETDLARINASVETQLKSIETTLGEV